MMRMSRMISNVVCLSFLFPFLILSSSAVFAGQATVSWDSNTESDLNGYKVYFGTQPDRNYDDVIDVGNVTSFTVNNLEDGQTYYFAVTAYDFSGNESGFSEEVDAEIPGGGGGDPGDDDTTAPELVNVAPMGETQIDVIFSEPLDRNSAENASNYSINNGIQVIGAVLDGNGTVVHLLTTEHEVGRSYSLEVNNVKDQNGNGVSGASQNYTVPDPSDQDTTPPELQYAVVIDRSHIDVIFNETLQSNSAENASNYDINNGVEVHQAELNENGSIVRLTTSEHEAGRSYTLSVRNVRDLAGNEVESNSEFSYDIEEDPGDDQGDNTPPQLVNVTPMGETQIDVIFTETLDENSAENASNYSINNGVQVIGAILDANGTIVHLLTSEHEVGRSYSLQVNNVEDQNGNPISSGTSKSYTLPDPSDGDTTPPELIYAVVIDRSHIDVIFSEALQRSSAENQSNYDINNGVEVREARLNENESIVRLTTSEHEAGRSYTLSVRNVRDPAGNEVASNSQYSYDIEASGQEEDNGDNSPPAVVSVEVRGTTQIDVTFSEPVDRASAENKANYSINGGVEVKGAILDANLKTVHLITSSHQSRGEYTLTVQNIRDAEGNQMSANNEMTYSNESSGNDNGGENGDPPGSTPSTFSLFQNYPNPFNPETEIRFYLERGRRAELKVYNPLGQLVKTLVQDELSPGFHTVIWDGTNNDGNQVPSGVYIYTLEVSREVQKGNLLVNVALERRVKKMTLLR